MSRFLSFAVLSIALRLISYKFHADAVILTKIPNCGNFCIFLRDILAYCDLFGCVICVVAWSNPYILMCEARNPFDGFPYLLFR